MALIPCPDCGREISDAAPSCLGCGRPMHSFTPTTPVVIEQTSKKWKAGILWGLGITVVSFFMGGAFPEAIAVYAVLTLLGIITLVVSLVGAWWNHS